MVLLHPAARRRRPPTNCALRSKRVIGRRARARPSRRRRSGSSKSCRRRARRRSCGVRSGPRCSGEDLGDLSSLENPSAFEAIEKALRDDVYLVRHAVTAHTGQKLTGWMEGVHLDRRGHGSGRGHGRSACRGPLQGDLFESDRPHDRDGASRSPRASRPAGASSGMASARSSTAAWTDRSLKIAGANEAVGTRSSDGHRRSGSPMAKRSERSRSGPSTRSRRSVRKHPKGRVCCVSHGDVIKLVVAHYSGVHIDLFQTDRHRSGFGVGDPRRLDAGRRSFRSTRCRPRDRGRDERWRSARGLRRRLHRAAGRANLLPAGPRTDRRT